MKNIGFRTRLLVVLALFAVIPSAILAGPYYWSMQYVLDEVVGVAPWEEVAASGVAALDAADRYALTPDDREHIAQHRAKLRSSLTIARRWGVWADSVPVLFAGLAGMMILLIGVASARVGGHLSRQLSRPLQELVEWTELIARGEKLPETTTGRGAPEFEVLRQRMRLAARELGRSRERALEAERLRASRESARQVAHELKNLLMPIGFAINRLRREATPAMAEAIEVLETETRHLEGIARSFSQFGKLPEGPEADIDLAEMVTYAVKTVVPSHVPARLHLEDGIPLVRGHHDALARALSNVLLNAVEASAPGKGVTVSARRLAARPDFVEIEVADEGHGIPVEQLARIWEPYVTYKKGGTGLGLAIARQTVEAHGGTVEATSTVGSGTVIRFTLPVQRVLAPAVASTS